MILLAGVAGVTATFFGTAQAHEAAQAEAALPWADIAVNMALVLAAACYAVGLRRFRRQSGRLPVAAMAVGAFYVGLASLAAAVAPPVDGLLEQLFSLHMLQHLCLMLLCAPLIVLGRPALVLLLSMPRPARRWLGSRQAAQRMLKAAGWLTNPLLAWVAFSGVFVFWHLPGPYSTALQHPAVHVLEHAMFLGASMAFWSVVFAGHGHGLDYGARLIYVGTAAVLGGLPGALMILAPRPIYWVHADDVSAWGLTLVQDQQLAGLIMWVPGGLVYLLAIAWLFVRWLAFAGSRGRMTTGIWSVGLLVMVLGPLAGCDGSDWIASRGGPDVTAIGDPERGAHLIASQGCGTCHMIPGIQNAKGLVGPPLIHMSRRGYLAGLLRNNPDNMRQWIRNSQQIVPGNVMPDFELSDQDASDMTAYLFTID
jgi:cytochrome c oxidase assembly factor CtaG/cytochrome c2